MEVFNWDLLEWRLKQFIEQLIDMAVFNEELIQWIKSQQDLWIKSVA